MTNAYITGKGIKGVILSPQVTALGDGITDEYVLRKSFLDQQMYYSDKKTLGEVIGIINGNSAKVTLFDDGSANVLFWRTKRRLTVKWQYINN